MRFYIFLVFILAIGNIYSIENNYNVFDSDLNQHSINTEKWFDNKFILFYSDYNCSACMNEMAKCLEKEDYIVITRGEISFLSTKTILNKLSKLFKKRPIYFEKDSNDLFPPENLKGGLFEKFQISVTPCIAMIKNNRINFLPYSKLFDPNPNSSIDTKKIKFLIDSLKHCN